MSMCRLRFSSQDVLEQTCFSPSMCINLVQLLAMAALYFRQTYEQNRHASMIGGCIVYSALPSLDSD